LSAVSYALRSSYHQAHGHSPAQLIYGRDMFLPVSVDIDWESIKNRKQQKINKSNDRENSSREPHQYNPNDLVTLKKPGILRKLTIPRAGPYKVIRQNNKWINLNSFQAIRVFERYADIFSLAKQRVNFLQKELASRNICTNFGETKRDIQRIKITHTLSQSSIEPRAIHSGVIPERIAPLGQSSFRRT
jgi:hypothetical protein